MTKRTFFKIIVALVASIMRPNPAAQAQTAAAVPVRVRLSADRPEYVAMIDAEIAPLIMALQSAGIYTQSCCSGHGKMDGYILLADGGLTVWKERTAQSAYDRYYSEFERMARTFDNLNRGNRK